jgi:threonine-phosphate decarboxylase
MSTTQLHGGDLDVISRRYGIPKDEIINFSGNVNPLGLPEEVRTAIISGVDAICDYPDVSYLSLREAVAGYTGADVESVVMGNGSTELISGYIKTLAPKKSVIISPAYSEYQREIELSGGEVLLFPLKEEEDFVLNIEALKAIVTDEVDLVVLCNPNNPTGSFVASDSLRELLECLKAHKAYLMIDETYIEFADDVKALSAMPLTFEYDNLFVIRGTSKFFSCPGLRLGYSACTDKELRQRVLDQKDPWSVNSYAELAGCVMFTAEDFIKKTRELIISERKRIQAELSLWKNIKLYNTQSNFFLFELLRSDITAGDVFESLIKQNMLVRDCSSFPYLDGSFIRFCIQTPKLNDRLLGETKRIIENN